MPWILPTFTHDLHMFLEYFMCILESFRVSTDSGIYWSKVVILGQFRGFMEALPKTLKRSRLLKEKSINASTSTSIDGEPSTQPT